MPTHAATKKHALNIKELFTGITIAFTMAFIFRGFVVEGFLIPTGSMAPTLLGKHVRVRDPASGYEWTVGPWDYLGRSGIPAPVQGGEPGRPVQVNDPMTRAEIVRQNEPTLAGDRLFVMKYLEGVHEPSRWEVVVFKVPTGPQENYIKRLVGLPGEQVALVDGDVFFRPAPAPGDEEADGPIAWAADGWSIARKPERVQRAMFQSVFDSRFTPPASAQADRAFRPPWTPQGAGWEGLRDQPAYRYTGAGPTTLAWDAERYPIDDYTPYNQTRGGAQSFDRVQPNPAGPAFLPIYPVSDVAVTLALEPDNDAAGVEVLLTARGRVFRAAVAAGRAELAWRPAAADDAAWTAIDSGEARLTPGRVTTLEFWHVDQALWLFADGTLVCGGPDAGGYHLSPAQRVEAATGKHLAQWMGERREVDLSPLAMPGNYKPATLAVRFSEGPLTLHRAALSRDVHYQPRFRAPARGLHPDTTAVLGEDFFMFCGDNSPNSEDARAWAFIDPWVSASVHGVPVGEFDPNAGLVHRDLLIGRAFVVYLPSPVSRRPLPVPMLDFGRMRWVW